MDVLMLLEHSASCRIPTIASPTGLSHAVGWALGRSGNLGGGILHRIHPERDVHV